MPAIRSIQTRTESKEILCFGTRITTKTAGFNKIFGVCGLVHVSFSEKRWNIPGIRTSPEPIKEQQGGEYSK